MTTGSRGPEAGDGCPPGGDPDRRAPAHTNHRPRALSGPLRCFEKGLKNRDSPAQSMCASAQARTACHPSVPSLQAVARANAAHARADAADALSATDTMSGPTMLRPFLPSQQVSHSSRQDSLHAALGSPPPRPPQSPRQAQRPQKQGPRPARLSGRRHPPPPPSGRPERGAQTRGGGQEAGGQQGPTWEAELRPVLGPECRGEGGRCANQRLPPALHLLPHAAPDLGGLG